MAVVPVTFAGVFYPKNKKDQPMPGTFVGNAWIAGLEVGGGPVIPELPPGSFPPNFPSHPIAPGGGPGPGQPIAPGGERPSHPIAPGGRPPGPSQGPGFPTHPIVIPPEGPPDTKLDDLFTMVAKEPPAEGGWGWFPEYGWVYSPADEKGPKR